MYIIYTNLLAFTKLPDALRHLCDAISAPRSNVAGSLHPL